MAAEFTAVPRRLSAASFNRTPQGAGGILSITAGVAVVAGEVEFIAAVQQWLKNVRFPRTPPGVAADQTSILGVTEGTGEASTPQMVRLSYFNATLSGTLQAMGGKGLMAVVEMEAAVPDYMLPKPASRESVPVHF